MQRLPLLLALALLATPAVRADELLADDWGIIQIGGADVGYVRTKAERAADEAGPLLRLTIEMEMKLRRMGTTIEIKTTQVSHEREDGRLVRLDSRAVMSTQEQVTEVTFEEGKAIVATTVMGRRRESKVDCPDDVVGMVQIDRLTRALSREAGATVSAKTFSPDTGGVTVITMTSAGAEETMLRDGTRKKLWKYTTTMNTLPIVTTVWADGQGLPIKTEVPMAGMVMEMFAAPKAEALKAAMGGGELPPDVFEKTLIVAAHPVACPRAAEGALLRLRAREGTARVPDLSAATQTVEKGDHDDAKTALLRIRRLTPPPGRTGTRPLDVVPQELADSLRPNSLIQSDAPEIVAIAQEVVGEEADAWRAAQMLERWVHDNITNKNMDVAFASALEVCKNREGDCTEHAVLLAALCRAAGIPADVVMGVVYIGSVWGGHAWSRVNIDGAWYPLDGTNGYGFVDALHLEFDNATLKDAAFATELAGVLLSLGTLDIEILEVTRGGKTHRPGDPALVTLDGKGYLNREWGIAFPAREGWVIEPEKPSATLSMKLLEIEGRNAEGKKCEIEVSAFDAPCDRDIDRQASALIAAGASCEASQVDGRPARILTLTRDGRRSCHALVLAGDVMWHFVHDRVAGDADLKAFADFLAALDFDA